VLCKSCHYPLKQLTERRCPECGREFDPDDPSTFDTPRSKQERLAFRLLVISGLIYLVVYLLILQKIRGW
jgi:predicted amidophosphoribosyltransferase